MGHSLKKNEIHRNKAKKKKNQTGRHVHTHECTYERTIIICYVIHSKFIMVWLEFLTRFLVTFHLMSTFCSHILFWGSSLEKAWVSLSIWLSLLIPLIMLSLGPWCLCFSLDRTSRYCSGILWVLIILWELNSSWCCCWRLWEPPWGKSWRQHK